MVQNMNQAQYVTAKGAFRDICRKYSILCDSEFASSQNVLASKPKFLRCELGKGRKPNKAAELSEEDIEKF